MKKILITGSGSGIGKDTALKLAKRNHYVYATTHHVEQTVRLNASAKANNLPLESFKLDIRSKKDRVLLNKIDIDVLINNAAYGESGPIAEIPVDRIRDNFETNVFSTIELTQIVLKKMIKNNKGRVIFNTSLVGRIPRPFLGPYSSTKFALESLVDSLRQELKVIQSNVDIIIVEPGSYYTGFNQRNMARKYEWMDESSFFWPYIEKIRSEENRYFRITEQKDTKSIVDEFVKAVEEDKPKFRYYAPKWQSAAIQTMRMIGK